MSIGAPIPREPPPRQAGIEHGSAKWAAKCGTLAGWAPAPAPAAGPPPPGPPARASAGARFPNITTATTAVAAIAVITLHIACTSDVLSPFGLYVPLKL